MKRFVAGLILTSSALALAACSRDEPDTAPPTVQESVNTESLAHTDWLSDNFSTAPYLAQWAQVNPQAYRPDNGNGVPLPDTAAEDDVIWQMPACLVIPYTAAGPKKSEVGDGQVRLSGWDHTERGAVAAAYGLFLAAGDSKNQESAVAHATGLSSQEAQRIVATSDQFAETAPRYNAAPNASCSATISRPTAWKIVDYSDAAAVIDFFIPVTSDATGAVVRASVTWKNGDWKLAPATFAAFDQMMKDLVANNGDGRTVSLGEYTQW